MDSYLLYLVPILIGVVYFFLIRYLHKRYHTQYLHGLWFPLLVFIFFIAMSVYMRQVETTGWAALGYLVMALLAGAMVVTYVFLWMLSILLSKRKK